MCVYARVCECTRMCEFALLEARRAGAARKGASCECDDEGCRMGCAPIGGGAGALLDVVERWGAREKKGVRNEVTPSQRAA